MTDNSNTTAKRFNESWPEYAERMIAEERERIAAVIEGEADACACEEDAKVIRETARLVRANFSYEEAERLLLESENGK